jgi:hypothetical protein
MKRLLLLALRLLPAITHVPQNGQSPDRPTWLRVLLFLAALLTAIGGWLATRPAHVQWIALLTLLALAGAFTAGCAAGGHVDMSGYSWQWEAAMHLDHNAGTPPGQAYPPTPGTAPTPPAPQSR